MYWFMWFIARIRGTGLGVTRYWFRRCKVLVQLVRGTGLVVRPTGLVVRGTGLVVRGTSLVVRGTGLVV